MLENFEDKLRIVILKTMLALYDIGIKEVHLGGMMRILGVDNENASNFDDELIELDDDFAKYVKELTEPRSYDQTLH